MTVQQVYNAIDQAAPFSMAMEFDNPGLLVGDPEASVTAALVALDVTDAVIDEAVRRGANLMITHHPVIFHPLKNIRKGSLVYRLIRENISVICAHTNLDIAPGGVNDVLAGLLELKEVVPVGKDGLVRSGILHRGMTPPEFAYYVKQKLQLPALRYANGGGVIERVAVCGGSGGSELSVAEAEGCQAYVTGDVKHDVLLEAIHRGITLLDAGHFGTEYPVLDSLTALVRGVLGESTVSIATSSTDPSVTI